MLWIIIMLICLPVLAIVYSCCVVAGKATAAEEADALNSDMPKAA
ncbi:MAG TPA: hypothetical protein VMG58_10250 [Candidatus Sulfotelmatobacter sp.]|nr:hypothetical protein [Candidatus Sulfotelmatobacter sp.]